MSLLRNKPLFQLIWLCQHSTNYADVVYGWSLIIPVGFDSRLPPPPLPLTVRVMLTLQALLRRLLELFLVECGVGMFRVLLRSL